MTQITFPPENFEQLRQATLMIRQGDLDFPIGRKTRNALYQMVENPEMVSVSNIVELSTKLSISPASLTRLAKLFGFSGFNPYQNLFKQVNKLPVHYYSDNLKKLLTDAPLDHTAFMHSQAALLQRDIEQLVEQMDKASIAQAVEMLTRRRRVYVFGYRQSSSMASVFRYGLSMLRNDVHMMVQSDHGVAVAWNHIRKDDALILIGSSPHSNVTLKIAALAKEKKCQTLVITDSEMSPLVEHATVSFIIPCQGQFYVNSQVINCFFIESLLSEIARNMGPLALQKLQEYELLLNKFQINN